MAQPARRDSLAANVFPIRGGSNSTAGGTSIDVDIRTRPDGSVMSVQAHAGKRQGNSGATNATNATLSSLILDFGAAAIGDDNNPVRIDALRFDCLLYTSRCV